MMVLSRLATIQDLEDQAHTLLSKLHGIAFLVSTEVSDSVVQESLLEALMPLAQVYDTLRAAVSVPALPWPRGTVVRLVDDLSRAPVYGVIAGEIEGASLTICQADGRLAHVPATAVQWVSDPCPTSWALLQSEFVASPLGPSC